MARDTGDAGTWDPTAAARVCARRLRHGSRSFALAARLLPRDVRGASAAFYAFCRLADDAIDEASHPEQVLPRLRERARALHAGRPWPDPVDRSYAAVVARHAIPWSCTAALLDGFAWDVEGRRPMTLSDTLAYSARVASSVGVVMTLVLGVRERPVLARACELGLAMQLSNIARDVLEDAERNRIYLPARWLQQAGIPCDPPTIAARARAADPALHAVVLRLLEISDELYRAAEAGIAALPWFSHAAIRAASRIYRELNHVIRRRGPAAARRRCHVATRRKLWLALVSCLPRRASPAGALQRPALPEVEFLLAGVTESSPPPPSS